MMTQEDLIGMKINLVMGRVDDERMVEAIRKINPDFRILTPETIIMQEHKEGRMNVYVNGRGIVQKVLIG